MNPNAVKWEGEIDGHVYRVMKLNGMEAANVFRRINAFVTPILVAKLKGVAFDVGDMVAMLSRELSRMPEEDYAYVQRTCLSSVVRVLEKGNPIPVMSRAGLQYADMSGYAILELMNLSIRENIMEEARNFSNALIAIMPSDLGATSEAST